MFLVFQICPYLIDPASTVIRGSDKLRLCIYDVCVMTHCGVACGARGACLRINKILWCIYYVHECMFILASCYIV